MTRLAVFPHVTSPGWIISQGFKAYCRFSLPRVSGPHVTSPGWIISQGSKAYCRFSLPRVSGPGLETLNRSIEGRCRGLWSGVAPFSPALPSAGKTRRLSARKKSNEQDDQTTPLLTENTSDEHIGNRNHFSWWLTSVFHKKKLSPSLDDRIKNLEFPFDEKGNQQEEILKEYKDGSELSEIKYLDIHIGSGDCVQNKDIRKLKVVFDYYLYDNYGNRDINRKSKSKSSHEERDLCEHEFGTGFNEGIRGMRAGGIRRFIVPVKLLRKDKGYTVKGDYAVFDVKLLKVYPSIACHARIVVFGAEN
ncbi:uncharacterized protein LOC122721395 isoform X2 [Manihot esculenta]|nr:uncharacterized protein LOC122721395 isoform X2 [Manihot esculenta]XP_043805025.1 uncharacterized protein LOC122721395 isoform X2 [Manihot esculenta]